MKKIFILLLIPLFFLTCKKDKGTSKPLFLGKIYEDGLLTTEYIYSADKKPLRRNSYGTGTGQSVFSSLRLYDYSPDGLLKEVTDFSKTNQFVIKYKLLYDINKRLVRMDELASDNSVQFYYLFEYTTDGYLAKFELFDASPIKKTFEGYFTNDAQGKVKKVLRYWFSGSNPILNDSTTFNFNSKPQAHWNYFEALPVVALPKGDRYFFDMSCDNLFYYYPDAPPLKTNVTFSSKEYNDQGYVVKQQVAYTTEHGGPVINNQYQVIYEYAE